MEEKELLRKLKAGDLEAFEKILFHYEKAIFGYLYRLTASRAEAEDLTQEIFLKVYQKRKLIDPDKNFKSWLYAVATNAFYDWLRKRGRRPELSLERKSGFETISRDSAYYSIESKRDIESALEKLKPVYRTTLLLFYREGLGYREIAETLSLSLNTVKTHLRRAKEELKKSSARTMIRPSIKMNKLKLEELIKELPQIDFPDGLHMKIMRKVFVRRFRFVFGVIVAVVILNLGLAGWRIGTKMVETGAVSAFRIVISGFEPGYDSILDLIGMAADYLPFFSIAAFLVNLVLAFYLAAVYLDFHRYEEFRFGKGREKLS